MGVFVCDKIDGNKKVSKFRMLIANENSKINHFQNNEPEQNSLLFFV